jgi:adenylate cyclase
MKPCRNAKINMNLWQRFTHRLGALPAPRVTWGLALVFCLWAVLDLFVLKVSGGLANSTYDAMVRARFYTAAPDARVVIVDIDEASLAQMAPEFGRWPWPRDTLATVLGYLEKQNSQAIAWDVVFSDADRLSPGGDKAFDEAAKVSTRSHFSVVRLPAVYDVQSKVTRAVLPSLWAVDASASLASTSTLSTSSLSSVALIPPVLPAVAASRLGYNNGYPDADGVLRRYRLLETLGDGSQIQSLAWSVAQSVNSSSTINFIASRAINTWTTRLFGSQNTDSLMIWRAKANSYPRVPFAQVFSAAEGGKTAQPLPNFAGKIVLIGSTASSLHDIHPTPLGAQHAGVDSLATAIDNAVNQRSLAELPRWLLAALAVALCVGMAWWVQRNGISSLDAALLLLPGALLGISYVSLNISPVFIDLHLAAGIALLFIALLRLWNGWRRNFWCGDVINQGIAQQAANNSQSLGMMALQLERPAADVGLDALIRALEQHAPLCRVLGGDATAPWPTQLRWPELLHTVAVAGPLPQLMHLRAMVLAPEASAPKAFKVARKLARLAQLGCQACSEPAPVTAGISRAALAERARFACAQLRQSAV